MMREGQVEARSPISFFFFFFFFFLTLKNLTISATVPVMPSMFNSAVLGTW
jgi:hypothetical protein